MRAPALYGCISTGMVLLATGCVTAEYRPPIITTAQPDSFSTTVPADYDTTWRALINHLSSTFFSIENFEKDSGLITVSFGASNPEEYIDCGHWTAEWMDKNYQQHHFNGPYVAFLEKHYDTRLLGKMNITARQVSPNTTTVRVNARYVLQAPAGNTWSFDSGSSSSIRVSQAAAGSGETRTCIPTYKAEQSILTAVKALVTRKNP